MRPYLLLALTACSADSSLDGEFPSDTASSDTTAEGDADTDADSDADSDTEPPEEEDDFLKLAPAATDAYVFVVNPTRDTVTRIAVPGLQVDTRTVGDNPTAVATTADYTRAVTFNEGSDDVTLIEAEAFTTRTVPVRDNFNSMAMSPDSVWVMCWYDPARDDGGGGDGGVHSYNEVSFVRIADGAHTPLAVGFNPHGVRWTPDGRTALVVSDAALAVVDLTADVLDPVLIELAEDPLAAPPAEEVVLSDDGAWAFVRQFGADGIIVVDLANLDRTDVPTGTNPTDMDLTPDGAAISVVARGTREIYVFDTANPFDAPRVVPFPSDNPYGSVLFAGDGAQALLYTNASAVPKVGVWDTTTDTFRERTLVKPIATVGVSPTGDSALFFHTQTDAEGADPEGDFYGEWAITLMDLGDLHQNPLLLPAEPTGYAVSDDGAFGFFMMEGLPFLEMLLLDDLLYEEIELKSDPVYVGVLPETDIAWASQEHDLGRISFYDAVTGTLDTVTGFELNSEIDHQEP